MKYKTNFLPRGEASIVLLKCKKTAVQIFISSRFGAGDRALKWDPFLSIKINTFVFKDTKAWDNEVRKFKFGFFCFVFFGGYHVRGRQRGNCLAEVK